MTSKQFFDWQTSGGTDDVMRLVDCLERADVAWCVIGGIAVSYWAVEPMVTRDVQFVLAAESTGKAVALLQHEGFLLEEFERSFNFRGKSAVSLQLRTEDFYKDFPARAVPADVHGILMRVAELEDTLAGKIQAWSAPQRRQSKRIKDLADIARLVEAHPKLWDGLSPALKAQVDKPEELACR